MWYALEFAGDEAWLTEIHCKSWASEVVLVLSLRSNAPTLPHIPTAFNWAVLHLQWQKKKPLESWDTLTSPKLFHWGVKGDHYNEKIGQFSLWHHNSVLWWKISIWEGSFNSVFKWNKWVLLWQSLLWCHNSALGWENVSLVWNNEVSWQHNVQKFSQKLHNCDAAIYTMMLTQLRTMI